MRMYKEALLRISGVEDLGNKKRRGYDVLEQDYRAGCINRDRSDG